MYMCALSRPLQCTASLHDPYQSRCFLNISIQPSSAQHPSSPLNPTPPLYLLGNVLLAFGAGRSSGTVGFEPCAQLVQSRVPLRLAVHGVSVEDGRWGLGAAQRRHFKPRESEWKIIEERNRERDRRGRQIHQM